MKRALQLITIACCLSSSVVIAKALPYADTVIINANIYSKVGMDAIAVTDGMISYLGKVSEIEKKISDRTQVIDLDGRSVYPGFIDLNNPIFEEGLAAEGSCPLPPASDFSRVSKVLERCIASGVTQPWIIGFTQSLPELNPPELNDPELMPRAWLDQLSPERPVAVIELNSDMVWVNTAALDAAQYHRYSLNPPGGMIIKTPDKSVLTGVLLGSAGEEVINLARKAHPDLCNISYLSLLQGLAAVAKDGITTLGDGRTYWHRGWNQMWEAALINGDLSARITVRPWLYPHLSMKEQLDYFSAIGRHDLTSKLIVNQVKLNLDGSYVAGTAKLSKPYPAETLASKPQGMFYISPPDMSVWLERLDKIGFGVHVNAMGDEAVKAALNSIQNIRHLEVDQAYSISQHGELNPTDIPRFASLSVSADFQVSDDSLSVPSSLQKGQLFSGKLTSGKGALQALYQAGANITLSSGWGAPRFAPLEGIARILSLGSKGLPDIDAAIAAYTINPAKALGLEGITGSIDVGKSADFVILEQDITVLAPEQLAQVEVLMTMLEGEVVYSNNGDSNSITI
ncbi:amidohydrolase [uncultured Photobacterium sp.]|uniref:amidohydrolase n=1 Tax=uncultured Photobacterium sp. TaxID=173973 RepID=UPI00260BB2CF|nr:amidohydrolase family protein [uncultured Photobacterium sp.]